MSRGLQIREPDVAIAIGRCVASRSIGEPTASHPVACGWCDYPLDVLKAALAEFVSWAGFNDRLNTTERHDLRLFAELPRPEQRRLAELAQGFPEPTPAAEPEPVHPPSAPLEPPPVDVDPEISRQVAR